jgi:hypothetical protein
MKLNKIRTTNLKDLKIQQKKMYGKKPHPKMLLIVTKKKLQTLNLQNTRGGRGEGIQA